MLEGTTTKERNDIVATLVTAAVLAVTVIAVTVFRAFEIFTPDGVAVTVPFRGESVELTPAASSAGGPLPATTVQILNGEIVAQEVNLASRASLVLALVVGAAAWLAVLACFAALGTRFLRGRFFDARNPLLLDIAGWTILGGALAVVLLETIGRNGVLAAVGLGDYSVDTWGLWVSFTPIWITAMVLGMISLAFRRGIRLQRDTEGLV